MTVHVHLAVNAQEYKHTNHLPSRLWTDPSMTRMTSRSATLRCSASIRPVAVAQSRRPKRLVRKTAFSFQKKGSVKASSDSELPSLHCASHHVLAAFVGIQSVSLPTSTVKPFFTWKPAEQVVFYSTMSEEHNPTFKTYQFTKNNYLSTVEVQEWSRLGFPSHASTVEPSSNVASKVCFLLTPPP